MTNPNQFKIGPEAQARAVARHAANRKAQTADLIARLTDAYLTETDRDYAEEFYGSMLTEHGIDTATLR